MPFFAKVKGKIERAEQADYQSLHYVDAGQGALTHSSSPLVSFFSCSISCQICKLLLRVTQELIWNQSVSKRHKFGKKKKKRRQYQMT